MNPEQVPEDLLTLRKKHDSLENVFENLRSKVEETYDIETMAVDLENLKDEFDSFKNNFDDNDEKKEEHEPKIEHLITVHCFPTSKEVKCVGKTETKTTRSFNNGRSDIVNTTTQLHYDDIYSIDPNVKTIHKIVVHGPYKHDCEDRVDPLSQIQFDLGEIQVSKRCRSYKSQTIFDFDDLLLPELIRPTEVILTAGIKNIGVVERNKYHELRAKILGKRKRENQSVGDTNPRKKTKKD